jgi:hypothetical protein
MKTQRPIEDWIIYQEEKKDRLNSWLAVPVSGENKSQNFTVKTGKPISDGKKSGLICD